MSTWTLLRSFLEVRRNEKKTRDEIQRLQEKKFRTLLQYAYHHSRFYHDLYTSLGITEEKLRTIPLEQLPVVDKDLIMDHFNEVLTVHDIDKQEVFDFLQHSKDPNELFHHKYHVVHTSGSSGKIGVFVYSREDWDRFFPSIIRVFDFSFRKNKSVFYGAAAGHYAGVSFTKWCNKGVIGWFCDPLILDITQPLDEHVKQLNAFQPDILGGYFTGLWILAQQQEKGVLKIHPKVVVNCGEGITVKEKEYIERVFSAPMTNNYGLAECPIMGAGKNEYDGVYLMDDFCIVEIQQDHALLTNLYNYTQPLIRYKINDFFLKKTDTKHVLPFTLVDDIIGRSESMIWLRNSEGVMDFIHPIVIAEFYVKGLEKLQLVLKDATSFEFLAVINDQNKEEVIQRIRQELDRILAEKKFTNVTYAIKIVDNILIDKKTGKFKLIVTNV